jgi:hypothetical protein
MLLCGSGSGIFFIDQESGIENFVSEIRYKHPGSATLLMQDLIFVRMFSEDWRLKSTPRLFNMTSVLGSFQV